MNSCVYGDFNCCSNIFTLSITMMQETMTIWGKSGSYLNRLQNSFRSIYLPEQKISIDEYLMHIKGRFTIKQQGLVWKCPPFARPKYDMSFLHWWRTTGWRPYFEKTWDPWISYETCILSWINKQGIHCVYRQVVFKLTPFQELKHCRFVVYGRVNLQRRRMQQELVTAKVRKGDAPCYIWSTWQTLK